ncbi:hypothetical protein ACHAPT_009876 [Fusarium lateritium]
MTAPKPSAAASVQVHHPGYRDILIDEERLSQMPQGGNIADQLITELIDPVEIEDFLQDDIDSGDSHGHWEAAAFQTLSHRNVT